MNLFTGWVSEIERYYRWVASPYERGVISLRPRGATRGRVLLAHEIEPFWRRSAPGTPAKHNDQRGVVLYAEALLARDYAVDIIDATRMFAPRGRHYDAFVGMVRCVDALAPQLPRSCLRIALLDFAHWTSLVSAQMQRVIDVQSRRGVGVELGPAMRHNHGIDVADYGILIGNATTAATYAYAGKLLFELPNLALRTFATLHDQDVDACRRRFLWLGGRGLAYKGLGLVLEAFARMPEFHLTVCGHVHKERRFVEAYRRELFETANVTVQGWIGIPSPAFADVAQTTLAQVYPSASEGQSGAVLNGMQAGLIPVVSRETGLDIDSRFGVELADCAIDTIVHAVRALAERPKAELRAMRRCAHHLASTVHAEETHGQLFADIVERILTESGNLPATGFVRAAELPSWPRSVAKQPLVAA